MSAVGRRYAKALFTLAQEAKALEPTADELDRLARIAEDPEMGSVLRSPLLSAARYRALATVVARDLSLSDLTTRFVHVLADHKRLGALPAIRDHYGRLLDETLGRIRITVRTAQALDRAQEARIVDTFAALTGKTVLPRVVVDPALLGGVTVDVAGKIYDGSVRSQLERLAKDLAGTPAH